MGTIAEKLSYLKDTTDLLRVVVEETGITIPEGATLRDLVSLIYEYVHGTPTYTLLMQDGTEVIAVEFDEELVFTATADDIRKGTVAATASGVTVGTLEV